MRESINPSMEGEIRNFFTVWISAFASLTYCFLIGKIIPKGLSRLLAILPVICLFLILPLSLHSIILGTASTFFLVWLATFKLLLFAFGRGPLSSSNNPPPSLSSFLALACFPIKIQQKTTKNINKSPHVVVNYLLQFLLVVVFVYIYLNKENIHPNIILYLYCFYLYISLEVLFCIVRDLVRSLIGLELEPQFNKPFLSTSLQDFWGRRWNLMVSDILRQTVYDPVRSVSSPLIGTKWAPVRAILATFVVSGLMHELLFYYYGREVPKWDLTWFFVLHGVCMVVEIVVKKVLRHKWPRGLLPRLLSTSLAVAFVAVTGSWLFIPELLRCQFDVRAHRELVEFMEFLKENVIGTSLARLEFYLGSMFKDVTSN